MAIIYRAIDSINRSWLVALTFYQWEAFDKLIYVL